jgi:hypothetical protein
MLAKQFSCTVIEQEMQLFCRMKIGIPVKHLTEVVNLFNDLKGIEITEEKSAVEQ